MVALAILAIAFAVGLTLTWQAHDIRRRVVGMSVAVASVAGALWGHPARSQLTAERARVAEFCRLQGQQYLWWLDRGSIEDGRLSLDWKQDLTGLTANLEAIGEFCMHEVDSCAVPRGKLQFARVGTKVEDLRVDFEIIGRALQNRTSCAKEQR